MAPTLLPTLPLAVVEWTPSRSTRAGTALGSIASPGVVVIPQLPLGLVESLESAVVVVAAGARLEHRRIALTKAVVHVFAGPPAVIIGMGWLAEAVPSVVDVAPFNATDLLAALRAHPDDAWKALHQVGVTPGRPARAAHLKAGDSRHIRTEATHKSIPGLVWHESLSDLALSWCDLSPWCMPVPRE